jgi:hypothetical protein
VGVRLSMIDVDELRIGWWSMSEWVADEVTKTVKLEKDATISFRLQATALLCAT